MIITIGRVLRLVVGAGMCLVGIHASQNMSLVNPSTHDLAAQTLVGVGFILIWCAGA